jgi:four helix bundle protein
MKENKLADLSMELAVDTIHFCQTIQGHYSLVNQIERSATSIGANIREANYAHGKADFIAKLQISLKECYETEYWLEVLFKINSIDELTYKNLCNKCGTIRRKLIASVTTAKSNTNN